jgi:hypothetical protein
MDGPVAQTALPLPERLVAPMRFQRPFTRRTSGPPESP